MIRNHSHRGFTIVELLLAMSFVSFLLMAITLTVIEMTNIYTKGLTMRAVSQAGQSLTRDIRRSIESARPLDIGTSKEGGRNYRPMVVVGGDINNPDGGRLCTGTYSYIWNNGKAFATPVNVFTGSEELIKFVKVVDNGSLYCSDPSRSIERGNASEMLGDGERNLALHHMTIRQVASNPSAGQALYMISLEIGTNDQEALSRQTSIASVDTACRPPVEGVRLDDYCAVNVFEFTARAGNAGGS